MMEEKKIRYSIVFIVMIIIILIVCAISSKSCKEEETLCARCAGSKIAMCESCRGLGVDHCYWCVRGTCRECSGNGKVYKSFDCPYCTYGCKFCSNTDHIISKVNCTNCDGTGTCKTCNGDGKAIGGKTCIYCNGVGKVACPKCTK